MTLPTDPPPSHPQNPNTQPLVQALHLQSSHPHPHAQTSSSSSSTTDTLGLSGGGSGSGAGAGTTTTTTGTGAGKVDLSGSGGGKGGKRQTFSCAECKRLKLRCSREWPCTSCVRRGVEQICPNVAMTGGKAKRLILADTEELHSRIEQLERALALAHSKSTPEPHPLLLNTYLFSPRSGPKKSPAVGGVGSPKPYVKSSLGPSGSGSGSSATLIGGSGSSGVNNKHNNNSNKGLARIKQESGGYDEDGEEDEERLEEISLGTLTIGKDGEAVFVGSSAGSNYLHAEQSSPPPESGDAASPTFFPPFSSATFSNSSEPSTHTTKALPGGQNVIRTTAGGAPTLPRQDATSLNLSWNTAPASASLLGGFPFDQNEVVGQGTLGQGNPTGKTFGALNLGELWECLPDWEEEGKGFAEKYWENASWNYDVVPRPIFDEDLLVAAYSGQTVPHPHKLACVFMVMAIGCLMDPVKEPFPPRAGELFKLGRACLTVGGAFEHPCIATVQALNLMCNFLLNDSSNHGANSSWPFLGVAMKVAVSLGLHRDGSNFRGLTSHEIEERRKVWYELITQDRLQAMSFARPSGISNRDFDTRFPGNDMTESLLPDDDGYHTAKYKLVIIMDRVIQEQTKVTPGSYKDVKDIDDEIQKMRKELANEMLPELDAFELPYGPEVHPHLVMHRLNIRLLVRETRIYLHRAYFAKALQEAPNDPSNNEQRFSKSFLAVFESAVQMIAIVRQSVIYHQGLVARWWFFWFHAFSAAVCLAAICIRAPGSAFAMPAYQSLVMACDLAEAAREGSKARNSLSVLLRLRQRASAAMLAVNQNRSSISSTTIRSNPSGEANSDDEDDLSHLVNRPQLRRVNPSSPNANAGTRPSPDTAAITTPTLTHDSSNSSASNAFNQPATGQYGAGFIPGMSDLNNISPLSSQPGGMLMNGNHNMVLNTNGMNNTMYQQPQQQQQQPMQYQNAAAGPSRQINNLQQNGMMQMPQQQQLPQQQQQQQLQAMGGWQTGISPPQPFLQQTAFEPFSVFNQDNNMNMVDEIYNNPFDFGGEFGGQQADIDMDPAFSQQGFMPLPVENMGAMDDLTTFLYELASQRQG